MNLFATNPRIAIAIAGILTAGCASALDPMREGQPVSPVAVRQLLDDPEAWNGKWVRVEGSFRRADTENFWRDLDKVGDDGDAWVYVEMDNPAPSGVDQRSVIVSGRVVAGCYIAMKQQNERLKASPQSTHFGLNLACKNRPVLEHVLLRIVEPQK